MGHLIQFCKRYSPMRCGAEDGAVCPGGGDIVCVDRAGALTLISPSRQCVRLAFHVAQPADDCPAPMTPVSLDAVSRTPFVPGPFNPRGVPASRRKSQPSLERRDEHVGATRMVEGSPCAT
ncbi:hypothetical protein HY522_07075 [bacterium]|nr:hypothetical protein [bacterium]